MVPTLSEVQDRYVRLVAAQQKTTCELIESDEAARCWTHPTASDRTNGGFS